MGKSLGRVQVIALEAVEIETRAGLRKIRRVELENTGIEWRYAAWVFLWENRNRVLYSKGFLFFSFKLTVRRVLKPLWELAFGASPFNWKTGPA